MSELLAINFVLPQWVQFHASFSESTILTTVKSIILNTVRLFSFDIRLIQRLKEDAKWASFFMHNGILEAKYLQSQRKLSF